MNEAPASSFTRSLIGFLMFIGLSFGITIGVSLYASAQDAEQQAAAALRAMLETEK